jgi:hypothetical protein
MKRFWFAVLGLLGYMTGFNAVQAPRLMASDATVGNWQQFVSAPNGLTAPVTVPGMAPALALEVYERRVALQSVELASYSSTTLIRAELPDTSQSGEFELQRHYTAPRTLEFTAVHFSGDGFVKSNVITRLLKSEVDHVQKGQTSLTAITPANYKFSYKGTSQVEGRLVHVYQVKPRQKRVGLFKGRVYLDAHTGSLVRTEGRMVKSPSFFIKKIDFVEDYADFSGFTFPVHLHSEAHTRLIGRAVVHIYHSHYQPVGNTVESAHAVAPPPATAPAAAPFGD